MKKTILQILIALGIALLGSISVASGQTLTVNSGDVITISSNTFYTSVTVKSGGILTVNSPAVLTVGTAGTPIATMVLDFQTGSNVTVSVGASLTVNGLLNNSSNQIAFNGTVYVTGNFTGSSSSTITGSGTFNTSGTIITNNTAPLGAVFNSTADCGTGPCNGNNLCSVANTLTTYSQIVCTGNTPVIITGNSISGTVIYQWESSLTAGGGFTPISGAMSKDYSPPIITNTTYYRRSATKGGCTSVTNQHTATVVYSAVTSVVSSTGSGTYTIPVNAKSIRVQIWGGGGGGSKGYADLKGTGGGGGGYAEKTITAIPGDVVSYTVGLGGLGATVYGDGSDGGISTATATSISLSATGGSGAESTATPSGSGGIGGIGSGGDLGLSGGSGANLGAPGSTAPGGGAGGSAGTTLDGNNAGDGPIAAGSAGGSAVSGGGAGGSGGGTASSSGVNGSAPGGGGGGNGGTGNGGNGANGKVVITVYFTQITYQAQSYCQTVTSATPTIVGSVVGAVFSSTAGLIIDPATGEINPNASTSGNYLVSYLSNGCTLSTASISITGIPTAIAGTNVATCSNVASVNITAGATATNYVGITWTSSGTGTFTNPTSLIAAKYAPSAADIAAGNVTLTLKATGGGTCGNATSAKILTITPAPTAIVGSAISICETTGAVNITTGSSATNYSGILWTTSNGTGTFTDETSLTLATYTPSAADITAGLAGTTRSFRLIAIGNGTCASTITTTKSLIIKAVPTANAGTAITTCSNTGSITIGTGAVAANYASLNWTSSGTGTFTNPQFLTSAKYAPSPADISAGNVILTLTAVGNATCANATSTKSFTITLAPTVVAGAGFSTCITSTGSVNITGGSSAPNSAGVTWTAALGSGTFANANSLTTATYTPSTADVIAGSRVFTLTATGNGTCAATTVTATKTITFSASTVSAGANMVTCATSGAVTIGAGATASRTSGGILWTSSGTATVGSSTSLNGATYTPSAADKAVGSVTLTLKITNAVCVNVTSTKVLTITPSVPAAAGTITGSTSVCANAAGVGYSITAVSGATNYTWVLPSGASISSGAGSNVITASFASSSGPISVTPSNVCGNGSVSNLAVTVNPLPTITTTTPGTRCNAGTVTLGATASAGTLDWYAGPSGGGVLGTGASFVTPSISVTTIYYVAATNLGCPSARTAVTATVDNACIYTWTGTTSNVWSLGSNWSSGYAPINTSDASIPSTVSGHMPEVAASVSVKSLSNAGTITFTGTGVLNVSGDISNTGTITTVAGSTINMVGTTAQTITGLPSIYNLGINNSAGVSLLSALTINGTLSLTNGVLTTNNKLTINFDADGNIGYNVSDLGTVSGKVSGVRNLVARTHYISVPFEGITSGQIDTSTVIRAPNNAWLMSTKKYDTQGWTNITNYTTVLSPISGYSLAMYTPATIKMSGTYTHGASYSSGNYTNVIPSTIHNGMYLMVGNPYPSTLDWDNATGWTKTNINDAIYLWNPVTNSVASYVSGTSTNSATQYIGAMQSFLVKIKGTGGGFSSVAVNNDARVLTHAAYYRTSSNQIARLVVKNAAGTSADETVVRIDDLSTEDFDSDADASKIKGGLSLYTKTAGSTEEYSINTLPITGPELLVPLNLKVAVSGLYTIECSEYSVPGYSLVLEDKQTATYTLLDNSSIYTINANKTDSTNRFVLRFVAGLTTGVVSGSSSDMQISTYDNQLMLNVGGVKTDNGTIRIYDASGLSVMELKNQSIVSGIQVIALPGLSQGVYIAKVEVDGTTYVGKVVLK